MSRPLPGFEDIKIVSQAKFSRSSRGQLVRADFENVEKIMGCDASERKVPCGGWEPDGI